MKMNISSWEKSYYFGLISTYNKILLSTVSFKLLKQLLSRSKISRNIRTAFSSSRRLSRCLSHFPNKLDIHHLKKKAIQIKIIYSKLIPKSLYSVFVIIHILNELYSRSRLWPLNPMPSRSSCSPSPCKYSEAPHLPH